MGSLARFFRGYEVERRQLYHPSTLVLPRDEDGLEESPSMSTPSPPFRPGQVWCPFVDGPRSEVGQDRSRGRPSNPRGRLASRSTPRSAAAPGLAPSPVRWDEPPESRRGGGRAVAEVSSRRGRWKDADGTSTLAAHAQDATPGSPGGVNPAPASSTTAAPASKAAVERAATPLSFASLTGGSGQRFDGGLGGAPQRDLTASTLSDISPNATPSDPNLWRLQASIDDGRASILGSSRRLLRHSSATVTHGSTASTPAQPSTPHRQVGGGGREVAAASLTGRHGSRRQSRLGDGRDGDHGYTEWMYQLDHLAEKYGRV